VTRLAFIAGCRAAAPRVAAIGFLPALLLAACSSDDTASPIVLGAVYNLSGGQESLDRPAWNGARLAAAQINAAGGLLGRPLSVLVVDGETEAAALEAASTQLLDRGASALFGLSDTDAVLAAAPPAAAQATLFLTSGATSPKLPAQVPTYLYLACFGDNEQAAAGAEYARATFGAGSAYVLFDDTSDYTVLLSQYFTQSFAAQGGAIALSADYVGPAGAADLSAEIAALKALSVPPDILYIAAQPDDVAAIVSQFRDAGLGQPILGGDSYDTDSLLRLGDLADGVYYSTHALLVADSPDAAVRQFVADYQEAYGHAPENAFAGLGYDTLVLLADAIRHAGSATRPAVLAALPTTADLAGVTGSISYEGDSHIPHKSVSIVAVAGGERHLAAQFVPSHVPPP
jgi:branched-chain amino acid transport system substrate-binding protein